MSYLHQNNRFHLPPQSPQPTDEEIDLLSQPLQVVRARKCEGGFIAWREMNKLMDRMIKWLEGTNAENKTQRSIPASSPPQPPGGEIQKKTALQVVNEMVKARLTQAEVDILDDQGVRGEGTIPSPEFKLLQERGLRVLSANIEVCG